MTSVDTGAAVDWVTLSTPEFVGWSRLTDLSIPYPLSTGDVPYIDAPVDELVARLSGRWVCRAAGHPYHDQLEPPRTSGMCDIDGSELYQRADDRPEVVKARLAAQLPPLQEVADHYARAGTLVRVDGRQPVDAVTRDLIDALQPVAPERTSW